MPLRTLFDDWGIVNDCHCPDQCREVQRYFYPTSQWLLSTDRLENGEVATSFAYLAVQGNLGT